MRLETCFWITFYHILWSWIISFYKILNRFELFWIGFWCNFDQKHVKINENHWKTNFHKIFMTFEVMNSFLNHTLSHKLIILYYFGSYILNHFESFWIIFWWDFDQDQMWKSSKIKFHIVVVGFDNLFFETHCHIDWSFWIWIILDLNHFVSFCIVLNYFLMKFRSKFYKNQWKSLEN